LVIISRHIGWKQYKGRKNKHNIKSQFFHGYAP
jgi:hypothetical protein